MNSDAYINGLQMASQVGDAPEDDGGKMKRYTVQVTWLILSTPRREATAAVAKKITREHAAGLQGRHKLTPEERERFKTPTPKEQREKMQLLDPVGEALDYHGAAIPPPATQDVDDAENKKELARHLGSLAITESIPDGIVSTIAGIAYAAGKRAHPQAEQINGELLKAASHALRSYQFGNSSPDLRRESQYRGNDGWAWRVSIIADSRTIVQCKPCWNLQEAMFDAGLLLQKWIEDNS
jgi:hypothetical protein